MDRKHRLEGKVKKGLAEILPLPLCEPKYGISFSSSYFLSCKLKGKNISKISNPPLPLTQFPLMHLTVIRQPFKAFS